MEMVNWEVEFQGDTFSFTVSVQGQPPSGIVVMDGNRFIGYTLCESDGSLTRRARAYVTSTISAWPSVW